MKWDYLKKLDETVDLLVKKARTVSPFAQSLRRPITTLFDVSVLATAFTYGELSATYVHNSTDKLYLTRLYCSVRRLTTGGEQTQVEMYCGPWGWFNSTDVDDEFDFTWNMRQQSAQRSYASIPLASQSLGGLDRGAGLDFVPPWIVPQNDSLTFLASPTAFGLTIAATTQYRIHFIGCGYRGDV